MGVTAAAASSAVSVHMTSAKARSGISHVAAAVLRERLGRDVYVLGAANVGKSAFVSALLAAAMRRMPIQSAMPGTTLGPIQIKAFAGGGDAGRDLPLLAPTRRLRGYVASPPAATVDPAADVAEVASEEGASSAGLLDDAIAAFWSAAPLPVVLEEPPALEQQLQQQDEEGEAKEQEKQEQRQQQEEEEEGSAAKAGREKVCLDWDETKDSENADDDVGEGQAPPSVRFTFYGASAIRIRTVPTAEADDYYRPLAAAAMRRMPIQSAMPGTTLGPIQIKAFAGGGDAGRDLPLLAPTRRLRGYVASPPAATVDPAADVAEVASEEGASSAGLLDDAIAAFWSAAPLPVVLEEPPALEQQLQQQDEEGEAKEQEKQEQRQQQEEEEEGSAAKAGREKVCLDWDETKDSENADDDVGEGQVLMSASVASAFATPSPFGGGFGGFQAFANEDLEAEVEEEEARRASGLQGYSLMWGGVARMDVLEAPPSVRFTFYGASAIRIRTVPTAEADDYYRRAVSHISISFTAAGATNSHEDTVCQLVTPPVAAARQHSTPHSPGPHVGQQVHGKRQALGHSVDVTRIRVNVHITGRARACVRHTLAQESPVGPCEAAPAGGPAAKAYLAVYWRDKQGPYLELGAIEGDGGSMGTQHVVSRQRPGAAYPPAWTPYGKGSAAKCTTCKQQLHQEGKYCQHCAYKKGVCTMCGRQVLDTTNYKQSAV
eukprot:jgi/Mesen1/10422/ME000082S09929